MAIKFQLLFVVICVTDSFAHLTALENRKVTGESVSSSKMADLALNNKSNHNLHEILGGSDESGGLSRIDGYGGVSIGSNVYNSGHDRSGRSNGFHGRGQSRRRGSNKRGGSRKRFISRWRWWSFL